MTALLQADAEPTPLPVLTPVPADTGDDDLSVDELGSRIVGLAGRIAAANCRWLLLIARFDALDGFRRFGLQTTARWLSFHCSISIRTASEHVRVGRTLATFPDLAAEMSAGRLSYAQVRAIARAVSRRLLADAEPSAAASAVSDEPAESADPAEATASGMPDPVVTLAPEPDPTSSPPAKPSDEKGVVADLITLAQHATAAQLETVVRGLRTVEDVEDPRCDKPEEYLTTTWTQESQWRCTTRLDPERGAIVAAALNAVGLAEGISREDALVHLAEYALAALNDSAKPPRRLRGHERAAVVIHLNAADAADSSDALLAHVEDGPGLPRAVVERLLCEGRIRTVVHDRAGSVLDLGRSRRVVSNKQYRALLVRQNRRCGHPGCTSTTGLEAHHVRHWLHGGRTDMANLILLCPAHHRGHHVGEFEIRSADGVRFEFLRNDGRLLESVVAPGRLSDRPESIADQFTEVARSAASSGWRGDRLDRHWAVAVLAGRRYSSRRRTDR